METGWCRFNGKPRQDTRNPYDHEISVWRQSPEREISFNGAIGRENFARRAKKSDPWRVSTTLCALAKEILNFLTSTLYPRKRKNERNPNPPLSKNEVWNKRLRLSKGIHLRPSKVENTKYLSLPDLSCTGHVFRIGGEFIAKRVPRYYLPASFLVC